MPSTVLSIDSLQCVRLSNVTMCVGCTRLFLMRYSCSIAAIVSGIHTVRADDPPICSAADYEALATMDVAAAANCTALAESPWEGFTDCLGPDTSANLSTACASSIAGSYQTAGFSYCYLMCTNTSATNCLGCRADILASYVVLNEPLGLEGACPNTGTEHDAFSVNNANTVATCTGNSNATQTADCILEAAALDDTPCNQCLMAAVSDGNTACASSCDGIEYDNAMCSYCSSYTMVAAIAYCNSGEFNATTTTTSGAHGNAVIAITILVSLLVALV